METRPVHSGAPARLLAALVTLALMLAALAIIPPAISKRSGTGASSPTGLPPTRTVSATDVFLRQIGETKAAYLTADAASVRTAWASTPGPKMPKPTETGRVSRTPEPTGFAPLTVRTPAGAGAIVDGRDPFQMRSYYAKNRWYVDSEGGQKRTWVAAGLLRVPDGQVSTQGVVAVTVLTLFRHPGGFTAGDLQGEVYLAAPDTGALRIVDAVGERLILRAESGATLYFDVPGRCYVSSLTEAVPTVTPRPTRSYGVAATQTATPQPPGAGTPYP